MLPLTDLQRDAFLDSAAIALFAMNGDMTAPHAYMVAERLLAERDRLTKEYPSSRASSRLHEKVIY